MSERNYKILIYCTPLFPIVIGAEKSIYGNQM